MSRRSRDRPLSTHALTQAVPPLMFIGIQKYIRKDFKDVLFLYVTVNIEPYGTEQIMLLCNKGFCPWMI